MFIDANSQILLFNRKNYSIWFILAFNAGCLNMGGFLAAHHFVTHITGYATHFGEQLSRGNLGKSIGLALVPMLFIFGSMISAWFTDRRKIKNNKDQNYALLFFIISGILFFISVLGPFGIFGIFGANNEFFANYFLIALLALSSGMQNAMISTASGLLVRTTHLTGISTDLGVGLVRIIYLPKGSEQRRKEIKVNFLRVGTIFSFVLGSVVASFEFSELEYLGFLLPALITGSLGQYARNHNRRNSL